MVENDAEKLGFFDRVYLLEDQFIEVFHEISDPSQDFANFVRFLGFFLGLLVGKGFDLLFYSHEVFLHKFKGGW
ncbi:MAG TPA: hypothetical protein VMT30_04440 [Candidatus Saccharimonadia bacterium]|nr:hypothetical protein [Candidatus Saccharimonadia bacterium]